MPDRVDQQQAGIPLILREGRIAAVVLLQVVDDVRRHNPTAGLRRDHQVRFAVGKLAKTIAWGATSRACD